MEPCSRRPSTRCARSESARARGLAPALRYRALSFLLSFFSVSAIVVGSLPAEASPGALEFRSVDGTGNNVEHPDWGAAGTTLLRTSAAAYVDGVSTPAGAGRPGARAISNALFAQSASIPNDRGLTDMVWQWAQFITHDTDLSRPSRDPSESFPIPVPAGDPVFDPAATGTKTIRFRRSAYDPLTGTGPDRPREQRNSVTSFLDASQVYGSDPERATALRTFEGGKLAVSEGNFPPFNTAGLENEIIGTHPGFFLTGDIRANEQIALTALHTLFLREHNRIADALAAAHPEASDEELYQRARRIVGAEMQVITYEEFLPALLGRFSLPPYRGYDPLVRPDISNVFATAAFRGHTMISNELLRLADSGEVIPEGNLSLREASLAPQLLVETGIDPILKGLASQPMQEVDTRAVDGIRNILFGPPGSGGTDIIALDIQRGRDHGLPSYNVLRRQYGLIPYRLFEQITTDRERADALAALYGSIENVDAFVGMFAERHAPGASVGALVRAILINQFRRLRDGDRFFYARVFSGEELEALRSTRLSDIIRRNTALTQIQGNAFLLPSSLSNPLVSPPPTDMPDTSPSPPPSFLPPSLPRIPHPPRPPVPAPPQLPGIP